MKFGPLPPEEAEGALLAHSLKLPGRALKKGQRLSADDVTALVANGIAEVVVARLDAGDIPEDEAARRVAEALAGDCIRLAKPFTGRCNLTAAAQGLAVFDADRIDRLNAIDEALTIATVPPYDGVAAGQLVATVKVIPLAAPADAVEKAVRIARDGGTVVRLAPFHPHSAGLLLTTLPGFKESVLEKTESTVRSRLESMGSRLARTLRCTHDEAAVAAALATLRDEACRPILIFGASAIIDRRDVVPAAIVRAGGTIDHFGMPVDPGNLTLLARLGDTPVLGLPGSARSPRPSGFDWILARILAGVPVRGEDLKRLGVGGLLKEVPGRPQPRERAPLAPPRAAPKVAAIVLAAGQSRRMGPRNKLLADIDGVPMVARVVDAALASRARPVIVVTGHEAEAVREALGDRTVHFVYNPDYAEGLSTSLARGTEALERADGVLVCLGDMPKISPALLDALMDAFDPAEGQTICVPTRSGKRGNPVLWGAEHFAELRQISGDVGARHLIGEHADAVIEVPVEDDAIFLDVDTPAALDALHEAGRRS